MYNSQIFKIKSINESIVKLDNDIEFPIEEFQQNFTLAFCITVYRYQGGDINEPYNIYDCEIMDKRQMYTALSRTRKFEYIHCVIDPKKQYYNRKRKIGVRKITTSRYSLGKIYHITDGKNHYVGSTIKSIEERLIEHKHDKNSAIYKKMDTKNVTIELICNYPCNSQAELEECEKFYINKFADKYGDYCVNVRMNDKKKAKKHSLSFAYDIMTAGAFEEKKKQLEIKDYANCKMFKIEYMEQGKRKQITKRYKDENKEEVLVEFNKIRDVLVDGLKLKFDF